VRGMPERGDAQKIVREKWSLWLSIILETRNYPSVVGTAEHILYIGRKQKSDG